MTEDQNKYFNLVWYGRRDTDAVLADCDHPSRPGVLDVMKEYPNDVVELEDSPNPNWRHGFNSDMLAASRLYSRLACTEEALPKNDELWGLGYPMTHPFDLPPLSKRLKEERRTALDNFPMLDT